VLSKGVENMANYKELRENDSSTGLSELFGFAEFLFLFGLPVAFFAVKPWRFRMAVVLFLAFLFTHDIADICSFISQI